MTRSPVVPIRRFLLLLAALSVTIPVAAAQADPGSELVFSPDTALAFPDTTAGQSSKETLALKNASSTFQANINGMAIEGPDSGQFSILGTSCGPGLPADNGCDVTVAFNPNGVASFNAQLVIDNDGINQPLVRQLTGNGVAPNLGLSTGTLDFGMVWLDQGSQSNWLGIQNNGGSSAQVDQLDIDGPDASAFWVENGNCQGQTLGPGSGCSLNVRFQPQEGRVYDATLHVRSGGLDFTVALTGVGGASEVTMSPDPVEFGRVEVDQSARVVITSKSTGNVPFQSIVSLLTGGDVGSFKVIKDQCSLQVLDPGDECALTIQFTPTEAGPVEAMLAVVGNGMPKTVTLRGEGVAAAAGSVPTAGKAQEATLAEPGSIAAASVTFARTLQTGRFVGDRVRLGRLTCDGAPSCSVTIRSRYVVVSANGQHTYVVRGRPQTFAIATATRVSIPAPEGVQGRLARLRLRLEVQAPGRADGVQREALWLSATATARKAARRPPADPRRP